jgi:Flp pilus assembly protein TadD
VVVEARFGDPRRAVALGRKLWRRAPSVGTAHALGVALVEAGERRQARKWARRSLRLGSRDPQFLRDARRAGVTPRRPLAHPARARATIS